MDVSATIRDLERRLAARRDALLSASATALRNGDAASHALLTEASRQTADALTCAAILRDPHSASIQASCRTGASALAAEVFLMLDAAARRDMLAASQSAGGIQSDDGAAASLLELARRASGLATSPSSVQPHAIA